jgi:thiol-disulfide isomerase/thioredoxin
MALLATGCGDEESSPPAGGGTPAILVADAPSLPDTVEALPDVDVEGYEALLGELRGTPAVVNFWATWCGPCTREMPMLAAAARDLDGQVQFVGIDLLDNRDSARAFLADLDVPYPNLFDGDASVRTHVGSMGQPVTIFYDADGQVVAKVDGELSEADLESHLAQLTASA